MERNYIAFISYRHAPLDMAVAKKLHGLIEQYNIPRALRRDGRRKLGIVFRDQEELPVSSDLSRDICNALDHAEFLIVVCSRSTPASPWVQREIEYFLQRHSRDKILTVLADGEPWEAFPPILTRVEENGIVREVEPLAADVRSDDTRRTLARLRRECCRLFAAMLGCPYDALILREQKRQRRRLMGITAAIVAIALGFSSMLLLKNRQIDQKNDELEQINSQLAQVNGTLEQQNIEMEQQNQLLAQQKAEVQHRESMLLTADAEDALARGDTLAAIRSAVSALPRPGDENRPYYAPAERALLSAMNVFGKDGNSHMIVNTPMEQSTPIQAYCPNTDGSKVVTMDAYGGILCFDTASGDCLWESKVESESPFFSLYDTGRLFFCEAENSVVCCYAELLLSYNIDSGECLWKMDISDSLECYLFHDPQRGHIAYVSQTFDENDNYVYHFVVRSDRTGEILQEIFMMHYEDYPYIHFLAPYDTEKPMNGAFSDDGNLFAGVFVSEPDEDHSELHCFLVDLQTGTCQIRYTQTVPIPYYALDISNIAFCDGNESLIIVRNSYDYSIAAVLQKIDLTQGIQVWETATEPASDSNYFYEKECLALIWGRCLCLGCGDELYVYELESGRLYTRSRIQDNIMEMENIDANFFGLVLENGYYAIGWFNKNGIFDSSLHDVTVDLGAVAQGDLYGGGYIQGEVENGYVSRLYMDTAHPEKFLLAIPGENPRQLLISRVIPFEDCAVRTEIPIGNSTYASSEVVLLPWGEDAMLYGPLFKLADDTENPEYFYALLDSDTFQPLQLIPMPGYIGREKVFFLPDLSGYVFCEYDGSITLTDIATGETQMLSRSAAELAEEDSDYWKLYSLQRAASATQTAGADVLSVMCDDTSLTLWRNGIREAQIPLPESAACTDLESNVSNRLLQIGANGYLLTGLHAYGEAVTLLSVYDTQKGSWTLIQESSGFSNANALAFAWENPLWAGMDDQNRMHIYNLSTGEEISTFPVDYPVNAVSCLGFLLDDSCLMMATEDSQVIVYDAATGEVRLIQQMDTFSIEQLFAWEDPVNRKLYIAVSGYAADCNGICIDLTSWEKLADLYRAVGFDSSAGNLFCLSYDAPLTAYHIPTLEELVAMGQQIAGSP